MDTDGLVVHPTPRPYPFGPSSVAAILHTGLADHPDRLALVDGERTWTWAELDVAVVAVATGIAPGEQIWWAHGNCAEQVIGTLATFRAGGVLVGISGIPPRRARSIVPWLTERIGVTTLVDSPEAFDALDTTLPSGTRTPVDPLAPAAIAFTSGTSGAAKAVVHSQRNLLWPGLISVELEPPIEGERIGTPLSLSIVNIAVLGPLSSLLRGSTFVVMSRTHASGFAEDVERFGVTRTFVVPALLHDLLDEQVGIAMLSSLDRVIVGGSGADPQLLAAFSDRYGVRPTLSYGLTEAPTGVVRESLDDPIGSGRGFPLPHVEVSIRNPAGEVVPTGDEGEICLSAATHGAWAHTWTPTLGYVGDPDRTDMLLDAGLLHTGDLGRLDEDGALSVTGRLSNLIIRGGMNVDPIAVERILIDDPTVAEAVVVGLPDERLGERIGAIVVPIKGMTVDRSRLRQMVETQLSKHAVPDVILTDEHLMRTEMGKLVRNLPPDMFEGGDADLADPAPITTMLMNRPGTLEG